MMLNIFVENKLIHKVTKFFIYLYDQQQLLILNTEY